MSLPFVHYDFTKLWVRVHMTYLGLFTVSSLKMRIVNT